MNTRNPLIVVVSTIVLFGSMAAVALGAAKKEGNRLPPEVADALENAKTIEVFSLSPKRIEPGSTAKGGHNLHGYPITGRVELTDPAARKELLAALTKSVADSTGDMARCFNPRHGIRVTDGTRKVELVICFECLHLYAYVDGQAVEEPITLTNAAQAAFDKALGATAAAKK